MTGGAFPYTSPYDASPPRPVAAMATTNPYRPPPRLDEAHGSHCGGGEESTWTPILQELAADPFRADLLRELERRVEQESPSSSSAAASSSSWTWPEICLLATWAVVVLEGLETGPLPRTDAGTAAALPPRDAAVVGGAVLAHLMEAHWSDAQTYAAALQAPVPNGDGTLLAALARAIRNAPGGAVATRTDAPLAAALLAAATAARTALHRLERVHLAVPHRLVPMVVLDAAASARLALRLLTEDEPMEALGTALARGPPGVSHLLSAERLARALVECLVLHWSSEPHDALDEILDNDATPAARQRLVQVLEAFAARLEDPRAGAAAARLGVASLHLLLLVQPGGGDTRTRLLGQVVTAALVNPWLSAEAAAGRTSPPLLSRHGLDRWALPMLQVWSQQGANLEGAVRISMGGGVPLLQNISAISDQEEAALAALIFLLRHCPAVVRVRMVPAAQPPASLLRDLLQRVRHEKSLQAAVLFHTLVRDRRSITTHDELSRTLWKGLDAELVAYCVDTILSVRSDCLPTSHPITYTLLDSLAIILASEPSLSRSLLDSLSTQSVESLVELLPSRSDCGHGKSHGKTSVPEDWNEDTPPANNLSRVEDVVLSLELSQSKGDRTDGVQGMEPAIAMAAATGLACISACPVATQDGSRIMLRQRITNAVNMYLERIFTDKNALCSSPPWTRCCLFLLSSMATQDNIDCLSTLMYTNDLSLQKIAARLEEEKRHLESVIESYRSSENRLRKENDALQLKLTKKFIDYQRLASQNKEYVLNETRQLAAIHHAERTRAEDLAENLTIQMRDMVERLRLAEDAAQAGQQAAKETRQELDGILTQFRQLEKNEQLASEKAEDNAKKAVNLSQELHEAKSKIDVLVQNETRMKNELENHQKLLAQQKKSENGVRESLETLFADLVNLSKLYELKEREQVSMQERGDAALLKLQKKVETEQARNAELNDRLRLSDNENQHLTRKYNRLREKLDQEREKWGEEKQHLRNGKENKRRENASYLSHLGR